MCRSPGARTKLVVYEPRGRACFSHTVNVVPDYSPVMQDVASFINRLHRFLKNSILRLF